MYSRVGPKWAGQALFEPTRERKMKNVMIANILTGHGMYIM